MTGKNFEKLRRSLGQLFVMGFPGERPSTPFLNFVSEESLGGVILFAENCPTHLIARQNIEAIRSASHDTPPFIAIDQEGGRVCRLKGAPAEYRAASEYGVESIEHFIEEYSRAAVYLEALGINLNLAPVADIFLDENNSVLAGRCFGANAITVVSYVGASIRVSRTKGLLSCLKHFPGLGAALNDPHLQTSVAQFDEYKWQQRERIPFAAGIAEGADLLMTTHILLPKIDNNIVTGSSRIIADMARGSLAFDGPIITDDLTMRGAEVLGDIGERTIAAFQAGHDLLLFGKDFDAAATAYDQFTDAVRRGEISEERLHESLDRVAGIKFKMTRPALR